MSERRSPAADIGLLLVHGIGRQKAGGAVEEVANALLEWFAARGRGQGLTARVAEARLKDGDHPARALIEVRRGPTDMLAGRLLLVESFWAEEFHPPGLMAVLRWMLAPGAWLLFRHVVCLPRRLFRGTIQLRPAGNATTVLSMALGVFALFFVVLPFQLVGLVLAAFWLVPFAPFRNLLEGIFLAIAEQFGDSYVFARDPVVRRAIADRVARDLERVEAVEVVVMAHSQGAAVALDMLELHDSPPPLITYGAGIRKLQELAGGMTDATPTPPLFHALWWLAGLAVAATIGVALNVQQVAAGNLAPDRWAGMSLLAMIALGIAGGWAGWIAATRDDEVDRALEPRLKGLLGRQHRWLDLFATEDFVPAGPLLAVADYREVGGLWTAPQTATLASARVVNQRNPLKDHTTYWANPEGFVDPVLAWIANLYGIGWLPAPAPAKGWRARPERMSLRYAITVILLLLVLALCWRAAPIWRAMVPSADWLAGWFLEKLGYTGPRLTGLSGGFAATVYDGVTFTVVMGLHVAALSVYESMVTGPLWRSFDRQLTLDPPRDASGWAKAIGRLGLYLLVAGLTVVALVEAAVAGNYRPLLQVPADLLLKVHAFLF